MINNSQLKIPWLYLPAPLQSRMHVLIYLSLCIFYNTLSHACATRLPEKKLHLATNHSACVHPNIAS
jgi:hypothetical protein